MLYFKQIILEYKENQIMLVIITVANHFLPSIKYLPRFHMIFADFLLLFFTKFHDFSRFPRCTLIFPGFSGKCGNPDASNVSTLALEAMAYITRSPKTGVSVIPQKSEFYLFQNILKNKYCRFSLLLI